jgi:hypothetical protein
MVEKRRNTIKKRKGLGCDREDIQAIIIIPYEKITNTEAIELLSNEENEGYFDADREAVIYWKKYLDEF